MHRRAARAASVAAFASITALVACGPSKSVQCTEVIGLVNDATKRLEEGPTKADATPAEKIATLRAMAAGMSKVADDLSKVVTSAPELKDFSLRYQKLAREFARLGKEMADGAEQNDIEKYNLAKEALDKVADDEGPLVTNVNEFCKGG
ncbi:MAG: hypothetical protein U0414_13945 [Polyangiaceae bacterium]